MAEQFLSVKNFERYQHYKDRNPPWIKLYWDLLSDEDFVRLDLQNRGLYCLCLLLASRHNNRIPYDVDYMQLQMKLKTPPDLSVLKERKFLIAPRKARAKIFLAPPVAPSTEIRDQSSEREGEKKDACVGLTPSAPPVSFYPQAEEVLNFLNEKTGRHYRAKEAGGRWTRNIEWIQARLRSGATVEQCRAVIAIKCRAWKDDPKMVEFLRPATLFGKEKFEQYLGEVGI